MDKVEDYIIREAQKGFSADRITNALVKAGYVEEKIRPLVEELAQEHGRKRLFTSAVSAKDPFLPFPDIIVGAIICAIIIVLSASVYRSDEQLGKLLAAIPAIITSSIGGGFIAERVLIRSGYQKPFLALAMTAFGAGLLIFLIPLATGIHPILAWFACLLIIFPLLMREMGLGKGEAALTTATMAIGGGAIAYATLALTGIIAGLGG